jgi:phospholipid/cholesterol/gamma-HCH transport system ATP-binding protein
MSESPPIANNLLSVKNLSHSYGLNSITVAFPARSIIGLIGPSGSGKSTLLKILGGIIPPDGGEVFNENSRTNLMFQEGALFDSLDVYNNVAFPLVNGLVPTERLSISKQEEISKRVFNILQKVGLHWAHRKMPGELSGGMRKRVSLARALSGEPEVLLLDDPTSGLDPVASSVIMELVVKVHKQVKVNTIIASHDLRRLLPICDKVLSIFNGKIEFFGSREELKGASPKVLSFVKCRYEL